MIIKKYLHSCILIEENNKKILIDPGYFSFLEKKITVSDIGAVDVILITHSHADHLYADAIKEFQKLGQTEIYADKESFELLLKDDVEATLIEAGQTVSIHGFEISAFEAPHEKLPNKAPYNLAYLINKVFLNPGDSFDVKGLDSCEILALPVNTPWSSRVDSVEFAKKMKPKIVIPVHDEYLKDYFLQGEYKNTKEALSESNIRFHPLTLDDQLDY